MGHSCPWFTCTLCEQVDEQICNWCPSESWLNVQADVENQGKAGKPKIDKTKAVPRAAAGQKWYDATLSEWAENDFRIFVGDMGNEVNDDILTKAFTKYATFQKAKIVRDKHSNKSKGKLRHNPAVMACDSVGCDLHHRVCHALKVCTHFMMQTVCLQS